ncbi:MBL fold metallo-hydrolase [Streptomyces sp. G44]|uniref:MBL fold metallo-hydrolase n=1 Tax=Streptomyces sp. G44 TaxID=2807632 RepID=UPI00196027DB|nr:MBL fold metallo-hydrolase [Streptomyces sp. G44]MBM7167532.1 MBL fold metallo-hydrolase [Streptomyces sp. G44]
MLRSNDLVPLPQDLQYIADGVYLWDTHAEKGRWGQANCVLLVSQEEAALIDTPYDEAMTRALQDAATRAMPLGTQIDTIINTHSNGDHCFGNAFFPGARIITSLTAYEHLCHEPSPAELHQLITTSDPATPMGWYAREKFGHYSYAGIDLVAPTDTFQGNHGITVGEMDVQLIEVGPAHTAGDVIAWIQSRDLVVAGDVIFNGDHPAHWYGPLRQVVTAVDAVLELSPSVVIPGHGHPMTVAEVSAYRDYLTDLESLIHAHHHNGRNAYDAAAEIIDSGFCAHLGSVERIAIVTAVEYACLDQQERPGSAALAEQAARIAWDRRELVPA